MTGSPILRLVLVLLGLGIVSIPAWILTGRQAPDLPSAVPPTTQNFAEEVRLTFTSSVPPAAITVQSDGVSIVDLRPDSPETSLERPIRISSKGTDLVVRATWPPATTSHNALRLRVFLKGNPLMDTTLWGDPEVEDVVTLPGAPPP